MYAQASMTAAPAELELPAELKKIVTMFKAVRRSWLWKAVLACSFK